MPPALYNLSTGGFYNNKEEMVKSRKSKDNMKQKIKYWKNKYGYDITENDYKEFNKHSSNIKHIYDIHEWFIDYNVGDDIDENIHGIFFNRQAYILRALLSQSYIKTLKKIDTNQENLTSEEDTLIKNDKYIIEF